MSILETSPDRPTDARRCDAGPLPVDPFQSLRPHFGMLLGVDDFETVDAYHRGKTWLHTAWLHRQGVVWGLGVGLLPARGEVEVAPGLAVDSLGRELRLDTAACVHIGRWYAAHVDDAEWLAAGDDAREVSDDGDDVTFTAHVIARAQRCLARQVPALTEPCDGASQTTAYSRVEETVELRLVPGPALARGSTARPLPYHRLRLLFGLAVAREEEVEGEAVVLAADQEVLDARAAVFALTAADQPLACLDAFRRFAALDAIDLQPAAAMDGFGDGNDGGVTLFPGAEPGAVVLAEIPGLVVRRQDDETWAFDPDAEPAPVVDNTVRDVHVATTTVQELLCGSGVGPPISGEGDPAPEDGEDELEGAGPAGPGTAGPRAQPDTVQTTARQVSVALDAPVLASTVTNEGVSVSIFDASEGWRRPTIRRVYYAAARGRLVVQLVDDLPSGVVRLVVRGTGPTPILGVGHLPFAGSSATPAGGRTDDRHNGIDFVHMIER